MLQFDHSKLNSTHLLVFIIVPHSALRTPISPLVSISFWWRLSVSVTCQTYFTRRWRRGPVFGHIWPGECVREVMRTADSRCQGRRTQQTPSHARPEGISRWQWVTVNSQSRAQDRSSPTLTQRTTGAQGRSSPSGLNLLSSATRSSLITILLLQPVFFLRSASRPGPS